MVRCTHYALRWYIKCRQYITRTLSNSFRSNVAVFEYRLLWLLFIKKPLLTPHHSSIKSIFVKLLVHRRVIKLCWLHRWHFFGGVSVLTDPNTILAKAVFVNFWLKDRPRDFEDWTVEPKTSKDDPKLSEDCQGWPEHHPWRTFRTWSEGQQIFPIVSRALPWEQPCTTLEKALINNW